jgi:hypothetical protein
MGIYFFYDLYKFDDQFNVIIEYSLITHEVAYSHSTNIFVHDTAYRQLNRHVYKYNMYLYKIKKNDILIKFIISSSSVLRKAR